MWLIKYGREGRIRVCYSLTKSVPTFWLLRSCVHTSYRPFLYSMTRSWRNQTNETSLAIGVGERKLACQVSWWVKHQTAQRSLHEEKRRCMPSAISPLVRPTCSAVSQDTRTVAYGLSNAWCVHIWLGHDLRTDENIIVHGDDKEPIDQVSHRNNCICTPLQLVLLPS